MRFFVVNLLVLIFATHAVAGDNLFTSTTAIKEEAARLGNEALEIAKTPVDIEDHGLIGTLAVAGAVGLTYVFDADIREKVQGTRGRTLDRVTDAGNAIGNPFAHLGVAAAVYGGGLLADSPKWQETGEMLGEAALLADASAFILKESIGRGRPFVTGDKGSLRPFQFTSDYDSMPSIHTASSFAMASVLAATSESTPMKLMYYSAAAFVGFSRIYQDKHWTSDLLLGAALGELCGRVVTRYHVRKGKVALVPAITGTSAMVAIQGSW